MNNLKKFFNKKKKSILSLTLALILMISFNYSPIALISNMFKSDAYKSSPVQTYYPNSSTSKETNINAGTYPSSLAEYFEGSSNNFNIQDYYDDRYSDIFAGHVDAFLKSDDAHVEVGPDGNKAFYNVLYKEFLDSHEQDTLLEYYTKNASTIKKDGKGNDFLEFAEYFMMHETTYTYVPEGVTEGTIKTIYVLPNLAQYEFEGHEYKSEIYNLLANFIDTENADQPINPSVEVKNDKDEVIGTFKDGVSNSDKFYTQSLEYKRVKDLIDAEIEETIAIYTYDNKTQNKNVAAILANLAPDEKSYYYKDNTYETVTKPTFNYVKDSGNEKPNVYVFATETEAIKSQAEKAGITTLKFDDEGKYAKDQQTYPLLYRPIQSDEYGYIPGSNVNSQLVTFYKYESTPYATLSDGNYSLYVIDDSVTADEQATYDFLYVNAITPTQYQNDTFIDTNDKDKTKSYYINVPAPDDSTQTKWDDIYFTMLFGITPSSDKDIARFNNIKKIFTNPDGSSKLYLRYKSTDNKIVYIQKGTKGDFQNQYQTYSYLKYMNDKIDFANLTEAELEEYYVIESSKFSNYYKSDYTLYFKKIKSDYKKLTSATYKADEYETKLVPNIPFKTTDVVSTEYEMSSTNPNEKKIYELVPVGQEKVSTHETLRPETLESAETLKNEYVKVPENIVEKLSLDNTHEYYYHHKIIKDVKQIYIMVDDNKYEDALKNEVYQNLNYEVLKKSNFDYNDYIAIDSSDKNYNKNFSLYYKHEDDPSKNIYVKNYITPSYDKESGEIIDGEYANAIYVIDDSVTSTDKTTYKDNGRNFIVITTAEYNANYQFYTQLPKDYNLKYTCYYKYNASTETERVIYQYAAGKDSPYKNISETDSDYLASDYELILPEDDLGNYVEGTDLFYKKIRDTEQESWYTKTPEKTTYYYSTNASVTLSANSYYVISFYAYTNGVYTNNTKVTNEPTSPVEASFYVNDTKGILENVSIENFSTNGEWKKFYLYIATNTLSSSTVKLTMYMGNQSSIMGSQEGTFSYVNGNVMFDEIKIIKINQTDFNKQSIDDKKVLSTTLKDDQDNDILDENDDPIYVDEYNNKIVVSSPTTKENSPVKTWNDGTFENMFNFDNMSDYFANSNNLKFNVASTIDGFTLPTDLWQMYISRGVSGQGNNYILQQYQKAYKDGKLSASVVEEKSFYEDKLPEEDEEDDKVIDSDKPSDKDEDVPVIESTFIDNNKVLKLENSSRQLDLGLISNYFTVNQNEYFKLTIYVYSPDEDTQATLILSSILKTASTLEYGSLLTSTATVYANMNEYTKTQANEYGWIPVSFYIEGNALHSQNCYLTLCANKDTTVYFDNITIEKITSAAYDTANSDSDKTTFCLSLTPSTSVLSAGVTNGYFNNVTVTDNYKGTVDYSIPRTAESWTISKKSTGVIAGVVPTTTDYIAKDSSFYKKYNSGVVPTNELKNNIYAIYAPASVKNPLNEHGGNDNTDYAQLNTYSFYSSSISLSASSVYKITFDFYNSTTFEGDVFANIYTSSVKSENLISTLSSTYTTSQASGWTTYTFYISTDATSATAYIELGIRHAVGTCFFRNISSVTTSQTIDEIRDEMISNDDNSIGSDVDLSNKVSFKNVKFIELNAFEFSIHSDETTSEHSNVYSTSEFTNSLLNTSNYTVGNTATAVATYYTSRIEKSYTVTIDKVEYYIKGFTDEETGETTYKIFTDSNYTDELTKLNGKTVTVDGKEKVIVGSTKPSEYAITESEKTIYTYNFKNDLTINNVYIDADELKNDYSENVLVLANSYSTDYTLATPKYNTTLSKTSYYVLKIYVKTSSFEDGYGLNIDLDSSISRKWTNIDTTDEKYNDLRDENDFVCFQVLISTNANSISSFSAKFSLGSEKSTCSGYAIIAGIELENLATEKLFKEYSLNYKDIDKDSNDTVIKTYVGTAGTTTSGNSSSTTTEDAEEEKESSIWATFFYIFSSLLLAIVLILAIVATVIKKHPIKVVKQEQNDHDRDINTFVTDSSIERKNRKKKEQYEEFIEDTVEKDDGFI